ncbi:MAG: hypothetical protein CMJ78_26900 [Planctomycetaceae bacterium]|nr:hypothetical protein [Planctomycetaceae bacterium]
MDQILQAISEHLEDHWIKILTGFLIGVFGWFVGRYRERRNWKRREFLDRVNISLNLLQNDQLLIRTIIEKNALDVFLNSTAVDEVRDAAGKTTEADPILPLAKDDYWFYLNPVLNEISEHFSKGQLQRAMGMPFTRETFLICLTNECAGTVRTRKVRAMLVKKDVLLNLPEEPPKFEHENHKTRWETLQKLADSYKKKPYQFIDVEICL